MKLYCYTIVNSAGGVFGTARESYTKIFLTKKECIDSAYEDYRLDFEEELGLDGVDENDEPLMSRKEFLKDDGYEFIQLPDCHIQYEYFEREI